MNIAFDVDHHDVTMSTHNPHLVTLEGKVMMDLVHNSCTTAMCSFVGVEHFPEWTSVDDLKTQSGDGVATTPAKTVDRVSLTL